MIDVSRVTPEARPAVEAAAEIYIRHAGEGFVGLIAHGSAVKGDFIAGCSDIDFKLFVRDHALDANGFLPFDLTVAIHRDLARIDPAPFSYIQCYPMGSRIRDGWTAPIPGAYTVIAGTQPVAEASSSELAEAARRRIAELEIPPRYLGDSLLDHGAGRLGRLTRLICTDVWPALISHLIVRGHDPVAAWNLVKPDAIAATAPGDPAGKAIRDFHAAVLAHYPEGTSIEPGLRVITVGVEFLAAVQEA